MLTICQFSPSPSFFYGGLLLAALWKTCVESKQKYKYNCLQKCWTFSFLPTFWGLPKSGALDLSPFILIVNPRLLLANFHILCYYGIRNDCFYFRMFDLVLEKNKNISQKLPKDPNSTVGCGTLGCTIVHGCFFCWHFGNLKFMKLTQVFF